MLIIEGIFRSRRGRIPGSTKLPILIIILHHIAYWLAFPQPRLSPDSIRILGQQLLSAFAYAFLIHSTTYVCHDRKSRWFLSIAAALFATAPQVLLQRNSTILGTSLMVSSLVFLAGASLRIVISRKFDNRHLLFAVCVLVLLLFQKISNLVFVVPIFVFLLFIKFKSIRKSSL